MNVLILVLSARREPWGSLMDCSMDTWDSVEHPQTQTLFYVGAVVGFHNQKVFYSPELDEELERVSPRTIEAFETALDLEWDFLARPNSSCYVHKKNLVKFCETLPATDTICGVLAEWGLMWGGCHYIFSRDVVEKMVANKAKWDHKVMDDEAVTAMAKTIGITLESKGRCASINVQEDGSYLCLTYNYGESFIFTDWADINKAQPHFFFRVKHDPDRSVDLKIMRELHRHYK